MDIPQLGKEDKGNYISKLDNIIKHRHNLTSYYFLSHQVVVWIFWYRIDTVNKNFKTAELEATPSKQNFEL